MQPKFAQTGLPEMACGPDPHQGDYFSIFPHLLMTNLVNEIDALQNALSAEKALREATQLELIQGVQQGIMQSAHNQAVANVLAAAQALINKSHQS
jgi:hypothetical protein